MENIYPPDNYDASQHFHLREYFTDYSNSFQHLPVSEPNPGEFAMIQKVMGENVKLNEIKTLEAACSPTLLTCAEESQSNNPIIKVPEVFQALSKFPPIKYNRITGLEVVKSRKELAKTTSIAELIPRNRRNIHNLLQFPIVNHPPDIDPGKEFVVSIFIFKPFAFKYFDGKNVSGSLRLSHEILALGTNTLIEIRDAILCSSDAGICKEIPSPDYDLTESRIDAKKNYPSACFFIDNVFYNDGRFDENSCDYAAPIIEWAKEKHIGTFHSTTMDDVQLQDLTPRLGYPYLYMHQADCEHLVTFSDAQLLRQADHLHSKSYPHVNRLNRSCNLMCFLCGISFAKWICVDSERFPQEKVFLCTECCTTYNYVDGHKVKDFNLYPYYQQHPNMNIQ